MFVDRLHVFFVGGAAHLDNDQSRLSDSQTDSHLLGAERVCNGHDCPSHEDHREVHRNSLRCHGPDDGHSAPVVVACRSEGDCCFVRPLFQDAVCPCLYAAATWLVSPSGAEVGKAADGGSTPEPVVATDQGCGWKRDRSSQV